MPSLHFFARWSEGAVHTRSLRRDLSGVAVEHFTELKPGAIALEGRIDVCPRCDRPGIERSGLGSASFIHMQSTEILGDGVVTVPLESCTFSPLPFDVRDRDVI
jgi:hypothetical protein